MFLSRANIGVESNPLRHTSSVRQILDLVERMVLLFRRNNLPARLFEKAEVERERHRL
jgi:hypothetical protein